MAQQVSFIGKGKVSVALLTDGVADDFVELGNCSKLTFTIDEETKDLPDYESAGGGTTDSVSRIKAVKASMECSNFNAHNLALALRGTAGQDGTIEALTQSAQEYAIKFDGLNEARSGAACLVNVYRGKFSPTKTLDLIGDDFGKLALEAQILKDASKTGAGASQYFTVKIGG